MFCSWRLLMASILVLICFVRAQWGVQLVGVEAPRINELPVTQDNKLILVKTHKTGSSTLSGVIWRSLCEKQKRHCFLPSLSNPGRTWSFSNAEDLKFIANTTGGTRMRGPPYDVWVHHHRRDDQGLYTAMNMNMTRDNIYAVPVVRLFSIVRRPADRFRSAWTWYNHSNVTFAAVGGITLEQFAQLLCPVQSSGAEDGGLFERVFALLRLGYQHLVRALLQTVVKYGFKYRTGLDATSEELVGLPRSHPEFPSRFRDLLREVAEGRVVLLVCERFEESLLVLDRIALRGAQTEGTADGTNSGYPYPHLLYLPQKQQTALEPMSAHTAQRLAVLQPYDSALYSAANQALDRLLQLAYPANDERMSTLERLKEQTSRIAVQCKRVSDQLTSPGADLTGECNDSCASGDGPDDAQGRLCVDLRRDNRQLVLDAWKWRESVN